MLHTDSTLVTYTNVGNWNFKPLTIKQFLKDKEEVISAKDEKYTYSGAHLYTKTVFPSNAKLKVEEKYENYDRFGNAGKITVTPAEGTQYARTTTFSYESNGRFLTQETNALGHIVQHAYESKYGNITQETDVNGLATKYEYDNWGRKTKVTLPDGSIPQQWSYHWKSSNPVSGEAMYYVREYSPTNNGMETHYDPLGREVANFCYTKASVSGTSVSLTGSWTKTTYDYLGKVATKSYPYKAGETPRTAVAYTYDNSGRILTEKGDYIDKEYTYSFRKVQVKDKLNGSSGVIYTKTYDALGNMVESSDPGGSMKYRYNAMGNPIRIDNSNLSFHPITFGYNEKGQKTFMQDYSAGRRHYEYNSFGELKREIEGVYGDLDFPLGYSPYTEYDYDKLGRVTKKWVMNNQNAEGSATYEYDQGTAAKGKVTKVTSQGHTSAYTYSSLSGRMLSNTETIGNSYPTKYAYYTTGQLARITYPTGYVINLSYANNQLHEIKDAAGARIWRLAAENVNGSPLREDLGNGLSTFYTYTAAGRLSSIKTAKIDQNSTDPVLQSASAVQQSQNMAQQGFSLKQPELLNANTLNDLQLLQSGAFEVAYPERIEPEKQAETNQQLQAAIANLMQRGQEMEQQQSEKQFALNEYGIAPLHDDGMQLMAVSPIGGYIQHLEYTYDNRGMIYSRRDVKNNQAGYFTYDNLNRILTDIRIKGSRAFPNVLTYDVLGNIRGQSAVGEYTYDAYRLQTVKMQGVNIPNGYAEYAQFNKVKKLTEATKQMDFYYGNDQQRTKTEYKESGVLKATNLYVSADYEEETKNGSTRKLHYIRANGKIVAIFVQETGKADQMYYIHSDHLGSFDVVTNSSGAIVETYSFDIWGYRFKNNDWTTYDDGRTFLFNRGYTAHEHLDQFGIINMNGRLYDPAIGRFFSPDPYVADATSTQGFNRYSYCMNNPMMYIDPSGESLIAAAIIIGAAVFAYLGGVASNEAKWNPGQWAWDSGKTWAGIGIGAAMGGLAGWGFAAAGPALAGTTFFSSFGSSGVVTAFGLTGGAAGGLAGYSTGFGTGMVITGGNLSLSNKMGSYYAAIGGAIGSAAGLVYGGSNHAQQYLKKPYYLAELNNYTLVEDKTTTDCLPTVAYSYESFSGGDRSYNDFQRMYNDFISTNPTGTTSEYFRYCGFDASVYNPNLPYTTAGANLNIGNPIMANLKIPGQVNTHATTIQRIRQWDKDGPIKVRLADPQRGMVTVSWDWLFEGNSNAFFNLINFAK